MDPMDLAQWICPSRMVDPRDGQRRSPWICSKNALAAPDVEAHPRVATGAACCRVLADEQKATRISGERAVDVTLDGSVASEIRVLFCSSDGWPLWCDLVADERRRMPAGRVGWRRSARHRIAPPGVHSSRAVSPLRAFGSLVSASPGPVTVVIVVPAALPRMRRLCFYTMCTRHFDSPLPVRAAAAASPLGVRSALRASLAVQPFLREGARACFAGVVPCRSVACPPRRWSRAGGMVQRGLCCASVSPLAYMSFYMSACRGPGPLTTVVVLLFPTSNALRRCHCAPWLRCFLARVRVARVLVHVLVLGSRRSIVRASMIATWLILPVVICLSQRLSHACLSINCFIL